MHTHIHIKQKEVNYFSAVTLKNAISDFEINPR